MARAAPVKISALQERLVVDQQRAALAAVRTRRLTERLPPRALVDVRVLTGDESRLEQNDLDGRSQMVDPARRSDGNRS